MFRLHRVEQYLDYNELQEGSKLNAIYQLDNEDLNDFISNYIDKEIKEYSKTHDEYETSLRLFDLETSDETIDAYCKLHDYKFNYLGDLINNNDSYKEDPYLFYKEG